MLTTDGEPVLFHDDTLQRTTGVAGEMAKTPFAVVQGLDASPGFARKYGVRRGRDFAGRPDCRVPSLEATVACLLECGLTPHVEIRSEEHTSELQSLMRTSYAVFFLKK